MAAPKGNKFWELRSKHGRDVIFSDAGILWQEASKYFEWCEKNQFEAVEYNGKDAIKCLVPKMRAFTIHNLCLFLGVNTKYFNDLEQSIASKKKRKTKKDQDLSEVITRIKEVIYAHQFTGAAAGFLNPNIIARNLGLSEKSQLDHTTKGEKMNVPPIMLIPAERLSESQIEKYMAGHGGTDNESI